VEEALERFPSAASTDEIHSLALELHLNPETSGAPEIAKCGTALTFARASHPMGHQLPR
jgi:hypothetical protein